jgi:hypothetical protein
LMLLSLLACSDDSSPKDSGPEFTMGTQCQCDDDCVFDPGGPYCGNPGTGAPWCTSEPPGTPCADLYQWPLDSGVDQPIVDQAATTETGPDVGLDGQHDLLPPDQNGPCVSDANCVGTEQCLWVWQGAVAVGKQCVILCVSPASCPPSQTCTGKASSCSTCTNFVKICE